MVGADCMIIERLWVPNTPKLSVTLITKVEVPAVVGVPDITPVDELIDKPPGKFPVPLCTVQVSGAVPPVTNTGCE